MAFGLAGKGGRRKAAPFPLDPARTSRGTGRRNTPPGAKFTAAEPFDGGALPQGERATGEGEGNGERKKRWGGKGAGSARHRGVRRRFPAVGFLPEPTESERKKGKVLEWRTAVAVAVSGRRNPNPRSPPGADRGERGKWRLGFDRGGGVAFFIDRSARAAVRCHRTVEIETLTQLGRWAERAEAMGRCGWLRAARAARS